MVADGCYELRLVHPSNPLERTKWSFITHNGEYLINELWRYAGCIKDVSYESSDGIFTGIVSFYKSKHRNQVASLFIHDAHYQPINQINYTRTIVTIKDNTLCL